MFLTVLTVGGITFQQMGYTIVRNQQPMTAQVQPQGGTQETPEQIVRETEEHMAMLQEQQELLSKREDIIRFQIQSLEQQSSLFGQTKETKTAFEKSLLMLNDLLLDRDQADQALIETLKQMKEAQESALAVQVGSTPGVIALLWPVDPIYGVSAHFDDQAYLKVFGFPHKAIDIPTEQGTTIRAPADGVVEKYTDNGYGYSWVTVRHNGYVTLYGHVTDALVQEGDVVSAGDPIAKSGGLPGSKGAGNMTTGPHLHFELITDEGQVDPLPYLPSLD